MNNDLPSLFQQIEIVPLESVTNITPEGLLHAKTDAEAIAAWLSNHKQSPRTHINYRKEAERLLLWVVSRGQTLAQLRHEDIIQYRDFLASPPEDWISKVKYGRKDKRWRPLSGNLSENSIRQAMITCNSLFNWLVLARYLIANPMALTRKRGVKPRLTRFLTPGQFFELLRTIDAIQNERRKIRSRWVFTLFYLTMGRISEAAGAVMGDFYRKPSRDGLLWWLHVLGKGAKEGDIPVTDELLQELTTYRIANGLPALPDPGEKWPIIMRLEGNLKTPITKAMLHNIIKDVVVDTSKRLIAEGREGDASIIAKASAHWFRHSAASELARHIDMPSLRDILRHENVATTSIYVHTDDERNHGMMNANLKLPTA